MIPKVSVIIPVFNRSQLLIETVSSVLSQTYRDFEVIIVDDGSTDDTKQVVQKLISSNPQNKIKYLYQNNAGVYAAINKGISSSVSDFIGILDSDDLWMPIFLDIMIHELEKSVDFGLVYCGRILYDCDVGTAKAEDLNHDRQGDMSKEMIFANGHISYINCIFRRECMEKAGLFDSFFRTCGDREFHSRFSRISKYKLVNLHLAIDRLHSKKNPLLPLGGNHHISYNEQIEKYEKYWLSKYLNDSYYSQRFWFFESRIKSRFSYRWGKSYYMRSDLSKSAKYFLNSVRTNPLNWKAWCFWLLSVLKISDKKEAERRNRIESHLGLVDTDRNK